MYVYFPVPKPLPCSKAIALYRAVAAPFQSYRSVRSCRCPVPKPSLYTELSLPRSKAIAPYEAAAALFQSYRSVRSCRCPVPKPSLYTELSLPRSKANAPYEAAAALFQSRRFPKLSLHTKLPLPCSKAVEFQSHRSVRSCRCLVPKPSRSKTVAFQGHRFVRSCCCSKAAALFQSRRVPKPSLRTKLPLPCTKAVAPYEAASALFQSRCLFPELLCTELTLNRALVLWNPTATAAAANTAALALVPIGQNPRLEVAQQQQQQQQQLASWVHGVPGNSVLALPGQHVDFVVGAIQPCQIGQHRASYINAILIQSQGQPPPQACTQCQSPCPGLRPFPVCHSLRGHFGGSCGNCKWRDYGSQCSLVRRLSEDKRSSREKGDGGLCSRSPGSQEETNCIKQVEGPQAGERELLEAGEALP